ncbi:tumor necrosis factor receptor superfamily member 3-like [Lissotriton helveticus]
MARSSSRGPWALALGLLFGITLGAEAAPGQMQLPYRPNDSCRDQEYLHPEYEVCCARCPPGMYAAQECTSDVNTVCLPCREDTYTEQWNYIRNCISCPICDDVLGLEVDISCSPTEKTKCKCKPGMFCGLTSEAGCKHCDVHSKCPPGKEVAKPGTTSSDTQCKACSEGWFQNKTSLEDRCQRHTECVSHGLQVMVPGTTTSDAVCSVIPTTKTTAVVYTDTKSEGWNYMNPVIILVVGALVSLFLIVAVLLIRNPSIYKKIGMLFRQGHQTANPHHQENLERPPVTEPLLSQVLSGTQTATAEVPTSQSEIAACFALKMMRENLQLEAQPEFTDGGPYMQETEPMSPSAGPGTQGPQVAVSGEKSAENPEQTRKMLRQAADISNGTQISAGANNGVHIEGKEVTINGDIYIFPQTMVGPPSSTEGSARPVQVTQDFGGMPTSVAEEGHHPANRPPPFSPGAPAWHCVAPQQEEGKDMHLATPESMNEEAWYGQPVRSLHMEEDGEMDLGQTLRSEIS